MCVIMIADEVRPTDEMVEKGFNANDSGAGIAWREGGLVHWAKGIEDIAEVQELCRTLPTPYVVHFRIPSEGGKRQSLCHPFPIESDVPLDLEGTTKGYVLFHNGHWNDWRKECKETALKTGTPLPVGKWSDTRGMAFMAAYYGLGILDWINEKAVAFGPDECEVFMGGSWQKEEGVWCSNLFWKHRRYNNGYTEYSRICKFGTCKRYDTDTDGFCAEHRKSPTASASAKSDAKEEDTGKDFTASKPQVEGVVSTNGKVVMGRFGGDVSKIPFEVAWELHQKGDLSRKQFKKARRVYEQQLRDGKRKPFSIVAAMKNVVH